MELEARSQHEGETRGNHQHHDIMAGGAWGSSWWLHQRGNVSLINWELEHVTCFWKDRAVKGTLSFVSLETKSYFHSLIPPEMGDTFFKCCHVTIWTSFKEGSVSAVELCNCPVLDLFIHCSYLLNPELEETLFDMIDRVMVRLASLLLTSLSTPL